jgi:hypothetical protein
MFINYTNVIMQTILLLTHDDSLVNELLTVLPKGHRLVSGGEMTASADGEPIVIIEINCFDIGRIRAYMGKSFVLALTKQERTGPVNPLKSKLPSIL